MEDTRIEALRAAARMWEYGARDATKTLTLLERALIDFELQEALMGDFNAAVAADGAEARSACAERHPR